MVICLAELDRQNICDRFFDQSAPFFSNVNIALAQIRMSCGTPFPSSGHLGLINIATVADSAKSLSDSIDCSVYVRRLTPLGNRIRVISGFRPQLPGDSPF